MFRFLLEKIDSAAFLKAAKTPFASVSLHSQKLLDLAILHPNEVLKDLGVLETGMTPSQVDEARQRYGFNDFGPKKHLGLIRELFERCRNPLVVQLIVICLVSLVMGDVRATVVVATMLVFSVVLAYVQEHRSSRAVEKLQAMVHANCLVVRGGKEGEIPISQVVPGDIIVLQAGSIIPADLRLIASKDFFVSQSSLTGESMPVEKFHDSVASQAGGLIDLPNACFQGSNVLSGSARGVAVNTGLKTHYGSISEKLSGDRVKTSFDRGIAGFTWLMVRFMMIMVSAVFLIIGLRSGNWLAALQFALTVAVGLTPEMLPMIVTVNLAKGAMQMARKKVIVKRLSAIQNLGAIDILCTDKTGTLTQDRVILEKHVDVANHENEDVLRYAYMNSYYQTGLRNLLDCSILSNTDLDVEKNCQKVDEIPFDFQRKRMSVIVDYDGDHVLICKGSVDDIYRACTHYQIDDEIHLMIDLIKTDLLEEYEKLSRDGYRVLALAYREFPKTKTVFNSADESELILLGYLAFLDPPKDSAAKAISLLKKSGVSTKILTGDNPLVTMKICREVGLHVSSVITGDQLLGLNETQLGDLAEKWDIFSHLSPSQKESIIVALQKRGHVVGYMGDGINDAPSMRAADVGISVDSAVDVAKESADIILLEKSLLVLEDGIIEGRRVFGNIIKYVRMGASSNFGNMLSVVGASLWFGKYFLPMAPLQVLVNNLLYDVSQIAIPSDRVEEEYLQTPQKWHIGNIRRFMLIIGPISSIFDYATFFLMLYFFNCRLFYSSAATMADRSFYESLFHTGWFVESLLTQTLIVHIIRTRRIPFFQSCASPALLLTTLVVMAVGAYLPYSGIAGYLGLVPLPLKYWIWIGGFLVGYSVLTHKVKVWFFKKYGIE
jgi:Mg2+-importing ATPase